MLKPFKSSKLLVARAREHFDQFKYVQSSFLARRPYGFFSDTDPDTREIRCKVKVNDDLGIKMPVIAFDIVNCLRSSLDHAVYDSARAIEGNPKPSGTKFPFGSTPEDAARNLDRYKGNEIPVAIRPFLLSFEPYPTGKEAIWELNELRNQKIHRILQAIAASSGGVGFGNGTITHATMSFASEWDHERGELTYMRLQPGAKMQMRIDPMISIGFGNIGLFGTKSAVEVFSNFLEVVERIVLAIEAETFRLKI